MKIARAWWPVGVWMALIFGVSTEVGGVENTSRFLGPLLEWLFPGFAPESLVGIRVVVRKFGHVAEYAILCVLCFRAIRTTRPCGLGRLIAAAVLISVAFAATDEIHQAFVPGRTGTPVDVLIDTLGAFCGAGVVVICSRRIRDGS